MAQSKSSERCGECGHTIGQHLWIDGPIPRACNISKCKCDGETLGGPERRVIPGRIEREQEQE